MGIGAAELGAMAMPFAEHIQIEQLAHDTALWGRPVHDERYVAVVRSRQPRRHTEVVDVHLVLRRGEEVLLGRRVDTGYADGLLHAPSGHVEDGEDVLTALIREAHEEVGVMLRPEDVSVALVMQHRAPGGGERIGWFFTADGGVHDRSTASRTSARSSAGSPWTRCRTTWWPTAGPAWRRTARASASSCTCTSRATRSPHDPGGTRPRRRPRGRRVSTMAATNSAARPTGRTTHVSFKITVRPEAGNRTL